MTNSPKAAITLPAESWPSLPWTKITRVDATFKAKRSMVANSKTEGKAEKSKGLVVLMAIMMITKLATILKVNKKSSNKGGNGKTNMPMIINTKAGIPRPE